jgi:DNA-3-methyladenine glycosylase
MPRSPKTQIGLPRAFYDRPVVEVARDLLGKRLMRRSGEGLAGGCIVEVEAYLAEGDTASHSHRGPTRRNATMFGPPGRAYVYAIHSRWCLNVVAEPPGVGSAVLIRAIEPLAGLPLMRRRRQTDIDRDLARGPGRLCQALAIDRALDGWDLAQGRVLWIDDGPLDASDAGAIERDPAAALVATPRIGVTSARGLALRFVVSGNRWVSGPRRLASARSAGRSNSSAGRRVRRA